MLGTFARLTELFQLSRTVNILGMVSDVCIAGSLIWLLQSSRTGFKRSDSIINRLIFFSLNTGLLTGLDAIASLVTITVFPSTFIYIMFYVTGSRRKSNLFSSHRSQLAHPSIVYTNSLMAT